MKKPVLVIMAAGMGSRYGGLKQIDPIDEQGHIIMDFSIYDAVRAGFGKVIFIIRREDEQAFRAAIGDRVSEKLEVAYAYQELTNVPDGFELPAKRTKPWGTGHAVLCASQETDGPFAVINADDFYGRHAFETLYDYLMTHDDKQYNYAMVGYQLEKTLTEHGHVARGVCETDENNNLVKIKERVHIEKIGNGAAYTEDGGATWTELPSDCIVSMNMWGFSESFLIELRRRFPRFLEQEAKENPLTAEYFLPAVVGELIRERAATVRVLKSTDHWYGVTYQEDKPVVIAAIHKMKAAGIYPEIV